MQPITLMNVVKHVHAIDYTAHDRTISISNVEFDSRKVTPGTLFVPLVGGATDGHDYVQQAIENGAVATLWSRSQDDAPSDAITTVFVDDTLLALQDLARYYRTVINPIVVGITGSNGKTTTKDMTASVLAAKYHVHKTDGNYNNEIGLPYTLLKMPETTEVAVIEMGMSGFGEIRQLSEIAKPDIAVITLIGESHLEHLGSRAGIAQAKLEIVHGLRENGVLVFPDQEPLIESEMPEIDKMLYLRSVGFTDHADHHAYDIIEERQRTLFKTTVAPTLQGEIPVLGAYNVGNALMALTVAELLDVPMEQAYQQLAHFELTANRLQWLTTQQGALLLNDAYNASPTSMAAVLQSVGKLALEKGQRRIAVLGDIRELGADSDQLHADLAAYIEPQQYEQVYLFGTHMAALYRVLQGKFANEKVHYEANEHHKLINQLQEVLTEQDIVLVKSSFGTDLLQIVTALTGKTTH